MSAHVCNFDRPRRRFAVRKIAGIAVAILLSLGVWKIDQLNLRIPDWPDWLPDQECASNPDPDSVPTFTATATSDYVVLVECVMEDDPAPS